MVTEVSLPVNHDDVEQFTQRATLAVAVVAVICAAFSITLAVLVAGAQHDASSILHDPRLVAACGSGVAAFMATIVVVCGFVVRRTGLARTARYAQHLEGNERTLRAALERKELLLREAHHRIKNNLQIVAGMLALDGSKPGNPSDARSRIRAIALLHEQLYHADNPSGVKAKSYIERLISLIVHSVDGRRTEVDVVPDIGDYDFDMETAIPCGLIVNELLTNALRHAFPAGSGRNGDRPQVRISLRKSADGTYALSVSDNGAGIPAEQSIDPRATFGIRLIRELTAQLDGVMSVDATAGTAWELRFSAREALR